jgi:two-component system, OmpR family, KDP operon response regulator KdpE
MFTRLPSSWMSGSPAVQPLVLIIEDEPQMRRRLVSALASHGFRSLQAGTRVGTLTRAVGHEPDLVLLDVGQPGVDGVGLMARLRDWTAAPILALVDQVREPERTALLEAGANDYLVKPFATRDLLARIRVWLGQVTRARQQRSPREFGVAGLQIDPERRSILVDGREVHITPLECRLLMALARTPGRVMTEKQIIAAVWGPGAAPQGNYLRAHIRQLRQKIEREPAQPRHLLTEVGGGYRLKLS